MTLCDLGCSVSLPKAPDVPTHHKQNVKCPSNFLLDILQYDSFMLNSKT